MHAISSREIFHRVTKMLLKIILFFFSKKKTKRSRKTFIVRLTNRIEKSVLADEAQ